jgi:hypothetical protein
MNQIVRIDKSLNKYSNVVLFPENVEKSNEMLRTVRLPKMDEKADKLKRAKLIERVKAIQSKDKLAGNKQKKAVA